MNGKADTVEDQIKVTKLEQIIKLESGQSK